MNSLPASIGLDAFRTWRADPALWLPAVRDIARRHALPQDGIEAFPNGTNLVVALGTHLVLKLFPLQLRHQFLSERAALGKLHGKLSVPTPEPVAEGEPGGWSYLVMTRLSGVSGKEAWPLLPEAQKQHLAGQLGALIAEVQSLPPGELSRLEPQWRPFILGQIEGCRARHERLGLPRKFLRGMDKLLDDARRLIPLEPQSVILTGEYVPENLLFVQRADEWRLSGLIDFGDVMTGFRDYDLMGPSAFMTMGEPRQLAAFLAGFGYERADIDDAFGRRLMALLMLHRFSDPMRHLAIKSWPEMVDDFEGLERLLWPRG